MRSSSPTRMPPRGWLSARCGRPASEVSVEAQVAALHALSFARHELGDPRSLRTIRAAIRIGERHGLERRTALGRRRLAMDLATRGALGAALRELEAACASLDGLELARSEVFRLGILILLRADDRLRPRHGPGARDPPPGRRRDLGGASAPEPRHDGGSIVATWPAPRPT